MKVYFFFGLIQLGNRESNGKDTSFTCFTDDLQFSAM